jgi:UDP-N-acetylmuramyl pentapeptide phosphotransferase/UDP-N-acetylglucosamine-1-phosphate transferase
MKSGYWDAMIRKIHSKQAVSEVVGVVLLLGITISLFVILNTFVFQFSFNPSVPSVNLIGTIDKTNNMINIRHNGGESLEGNINVLIVIGSHTYQNSSSDLLLDLNADNKWNFGETVQFHSPELITDKYIRATIVDTNTNTILLSVVLQQGLS